MNDNASSQHRPDPADDRLIAAIRYAYELMPRLPEEAVDGGRLRSEEGEAGTGVILDPPASAWLALAVARSCVMARDAELPDRAPELRTNYARAAATAESELLTAAVEQAVLRVAEDGPAEGESVTVAAIVDRVFVAFTGNRRLSPSARRTFFRRAAEVMRRSLRQLAHNELAGRRRLQVLEPVNARSHVIFAGGPAGTVRVTEWWPEFAARRPDAGEAYALHRFAGRTAEQLVEVLDLSLGEVDRLLCDASRELNRSHPAGRTTDAAGAAT